MRVAVITAPAADEELAADRLWVAGARAVEVRDGPEGSVEVCSVLAADDAVSRARIGLLPDPWRLSFEEAPDAVEAWRDHVVPVWINESLILRPAWLDPIGQPGVTEIAVEPGGAFGLGDHPTTRLSADAVWRAVRPGMRVLDVGCGSGVLSIVAANRGAREVVAIDISDAAVEATTVNLMTAIADRVVGTPVLDVSTTPLAMVGGRFDVVVANILAPTLIALADDLRRVTAPGGRLIVSGLLATRTGHVVDALAPFEVVERADLDGWTAIVLSAP